MHPSPSLALVVVASPFLSSVFAADVNYTIDDQLGDVTNGATIAYSPNGAWSAGAQCNCQVNPDLSKAYDSTWTWTKYQPTNQSDDPFGGQIRATEVAFNGSAVYVQAILYNSKVAPRGTSDYTFFIDGRSQSVFQQASVNDSSYDYNVTIFSMSGLSNEQHTLRIEVGHLNETAIALLDSIVYTQSKQDTVASGNGGNSSRSRVSAGAIAGSVVGGLVLLSAVVALVILLLRRRRRRSRWISPCSPSASSFESLTGAALSSSHVANAIPYITLDPRPGNGIATDPQSSGMRFSIHEGDQECIHSHKSSPFSMDQIQPRVVSISTLSVIPPTYSFVDFSPTDSGTSSAAPFAEIISPLPSYSEATLAHDVPRPLLRVKPKPI